jgi:hypothetical protein
MTNMLLQHGGCSRAMAVAKLMALVEGKLSKLQHSEEDL